MGVCKLPGIAPDGMAHIFRRIDIRMIPIDEYHCGTLYFTGSDELNKEMRRKGIDLGFRLSEHNIRFGNKIAALRLDSH